MSAPITLKCPNCAAPLRSDDLNLSTGIIKCGHCGVLSTIPGSAPGTPVQGFRPRVEVPQPPDLDVEQSAQGLEIKRRWFSPAVLFLIPFCIAWDGFLVFWYSAAFGDAGAPWIAKVFPIAHVAIGVGLTYFTLAALVNSTVIRARGGLLSVSHRPMPWAGNVEFDTSGITQVFCKEQSWQNKNDGNHHYEVWAVLHDSTTKKVAGAGLTLEQALFIEQKLERSLGIEDKSVLGEVSR